MSKIINNREYFICKYDENKLPQFDSVITKNGSVKNRDPEILLSQLGGAYVRGDDTEYTKILAMFWVAMRELKSQGNHGARLAEAYKRRLTLFQQDPSKFAGKYILDWLDAKIARQ